ncbi:hypothetical protein NT2_01_02300 [Caenibius tardaugens NBRC 16725]|uniref:SMP-30/Gluconolactonase/LRE-like region domain-containing protein n=1 Tax=Caenibius tardaugens NBRC 16725 TaxID=1219035 RepID=U2YHQ2_9SPHN|nr:hypothetical protein [Caenibius tardaugens]AZI37286.1 hypothetical protein EGO55_15995 [Caenibius tardaugens NBRC 16725]GAD47462.1 hypothetical protein NT2_01_02300 [Caenibius tardaugens NBRC 16725]
MSRLPHKTVKLVGYVAMVGCWTAQVQAAATPITLVCGAANVEDMAALRGTPWIVGGGMGDRYFQGGGLHLIDTRTNRIHKAELAMAADARPEAPYDACPGPVSPAQFSAHGVNAALGPDGAYRIYAVNHGGRESIEIFRAAITSGTPVLQWIGCVLTPDTVMTNAIAAQADGTLVLSASNAGTARLPSFYALSQRPPAEQGHEWDGETAGQQKGLVLTWTREQGWAPVANSALPGNNGIELSRDGQWAYVNAWSGESVTRIPLDPARGKPVTAKLGFKADNIRWGDDGTLIATGQRATEQEVIACAFGDGSACAIPYRAAVIDPETLAVTPLYDGKGSDRFGAATVGLKTGNALWLGSLRSDCVARVTLPHRAAKALD